MWDRYSQAETIAKEKSEIEWALIRTSYLSDYAHLIAQMRILGAEQKKDLQVFSSEFEKQAQGFLFTILAEFDRCIKILDSYSMMDTIADTLCDGADVYDILGDVNKRNQLAKQSLEISIQKGFADTVVRAQRILQNKNTFSAVFESLTKQVASDDKDEFLVHLGINSYAERALPL